MKTVGLHLTYPDLTGRRLAEGGRRLLEDRARPSDAPLVTVITVCFNSARTIRQTFDSIRNQTYPNIEYLVIDGGSQDATLTILQDHADLIDYFVSEPDEGLYHAMNKGLSLASGDYILILNSDDWYAEDAIESLVQAHRNSGCDFSGALARYVNADGSTHVLPKMRFDYASLLRMPLRHQTMLIPAALYNEIGPYDTSFSIISDFDFAIRLFQAHKSYCEVERPLLNFRTTGVSSTAPQRVHAEHHALLRKVFPFLAEESIRRINDHSRATPEDFLQVAAAHPDEKDLVLAVRDLIRDFGRVWGGIWREVDLEKHAALAGRRFPKISVIIPLYNAAGFVAKTLQTVLMQDVSEIEVICVDDKGTDDSAARVAALSATDARVRLVAHPRNRGPGAARNTGLRAARGDYVFFLDADDALPKGALSALYRMARAQGAEIVRGAFRVERSLHGKAVSTVKYPTQDPYAEIAYTTLAQTPDLLQTTEGHWACLYDRSFAQTILYPEQLHIGEDSLFLIKALARAERISAIPDIVYVYQDNAGSLMNSQSVTRYLDEVAWRAQAWAVLDQAGARARGDYFLYAYWDAASLKALPDRLTEQDAFAFFRALRDAFGHAGGRVRDRCPDPALREIFLTGFARFGLAESAQARRQPLRIAILSTFEGGGAGIASQRCMQALRDAEQEAFSVCIFRKSNAGNVFLAPLSSPALEVMRSEDVGKLWAHWSQTVSLSAQTTPSSRARELFSTPEPLVNATTLGRSLASVDLLHLHWVAGMLDYPHLAELVGDKPVVWTLHDMNPFTGGCHYSEGCTRFEQGCRDCPLLSPGATAAHDYLMRKSAALSKINTLHIICPSQWLADCARASWLFRDRPVHVIPNVMPVHRFAPTEKTVARLKLGLPLDRGYIAFGADSLANTRKGGHILAESLRQMHSHLREQKIEALFFGAADLPVSIPARNLGFISDPERLALVYAAADVFAFPSLEDNAPQTVVESLLAGTPVVSFPVGNVPDLIRHQESGYLARYGDGDDFAKGLVWALAGKATPKNLTRGLIGHRDALRHQDPKAIVQRHLDLFDSILATGAA